MKIITPIKQVPETGNVRMDEHTGTMKRDGVESIINPLDLYAVECALELKEKHGGEVTAVTMGPPSAEKALKEAIAMGCDRGVLLSGREFAGSDTRATAYALSKCIGRLGGYDLICCGERATDGDTGQVGPAIAAFLNVPVATYVSSVESPGPDDGDESGLVKSLTVERLIEDGYERLKLPLPALLTVVKEINHPRLPTLSGKKKAKKIKIPPCNARSFSMGKEKLGLAGSPTRVVSIHRPKVARNGRIVDARDENRREHAVDELFACLCRHGYAESENEP